MEYHHGHLNLSSKRKVRWLRINVPWIAHILFWRCILWVYLQHNASKLGGRVFVFTPTRCSRGTRQEIHTLIWVIEFEHRSLGFDFITPLAVSWILGSGETSFSEATCFREADYRVCQCVSRSTAKNRRSEPLADQGIPHHHHLPFSWGTRPHTHYSARNSSGRDASNRLNFESTKLEMILS